MLVNSLFLIKMFQVHILDILIWQLWIWHDLFYGIRDARATVAVLGITYELFIILYLISLITKSKAINTHLWRKCDWISLIWENLFLSFLYLTTEVLFCSLQAELTNETRIKWLVFLKYSRLPNSRIVPNERIGGNFFEIC